MKHHFPFLHFALVLVLVPMILFSNPIPKNELQSIGIMAFKKVSGMDTSVNGCHFKEIRFLGSDVEKPLIAVLNFDIGFVVVSADDAVMPVLAYSNMCGLNLDDAAPGALFWLELYQNEIQYVRDNNIAATEAIVEEWNSLRGMKNSQTMVVVSPLLTSMWNQTKYYNQYSPIDRESPTGYDGRTPNGCVAVAMASILYYYRYPEHGRGSHTNYYSNYDSYYVNFAQQTYNYEAMEDQLSFYNNEVAKLIFHCATSVDMMYSPEGSGAYSEQVPNAVKQYFGYSNSCSFERKYNYQESAWKQLLKQELDMAHPLYYSGYSQDGGHAFVCDGYNSDDLFHFNFGWGGSSNGYYALSATGGAVNPVGGFDGYQGAIINFYPSDEAYPYFCTSKTISCSKGTLEDGSSILDYQNNTNCTYVIAGDQAIRYYLNFDYFDTQAGRDSLTFWNGNPHNGQKLLTLSGSSLSTDSYVLDADSLYITFVTDDSITAKGWRFDFEVERAVDICNSNVFYTPAGTISDGSGNNQYGDNMNCFWKIRIPEAEKIKISFSEFGISPEDELRVYNWKMFPQVLLASYSGNDVPEPEIFNTNYIEIMFVTDNYLNGDGFTLSWTTDTAAGVQDFEDESINVFPNPADSKLFVQFPEILDLSDMRIFDCAGRQINVDWNIQGTKCVLNVQNLRNGVYYLIGQNQSSTIKKKFVVCR